MLPAPKTGPQDPDTQLPLSALQGETLQCLDRELAARQLNAYGDRDGTTYEAGAPLGVNTVGDRITYVFRRRPDIAVACTRALGEPGF